MHPRRDSNVHAWLSPPRRAVRRGRCRVYIIDRTTTRGRAAMVESRRALRLVGVIIAAALIAGCGAEQQERYDIKFPHVTAPATPKGQAAQLSQVLAEARFPGRVSVEVYPSGQLMEDSDSLEALAFGEIQMIAVSLSVFDRRTTRFQVFGFAFLFPDLERGERGQ